MTQIRKNQMLFASGSSKIESKLDSKSENKKKLRTFSGTAYNGGIMRPSWGANVVIDLSGMKVLKKQRPQLKDHDSGKVVGHANKFIIASTLMISGVMSGSNEWTTEVINAADNGFEWQLSVGIEVLEFRLVKKDEVVTVNGRTFRNQEFFLITKSILKENSFVALGADDSTSVLVASYFNNYLGDTKMKFADWLKAKGFDDESKLTADQRTSLEAMFNAELAASANNTESNEGEDENEGDEPIQEPVVQASAKKAKVVKSGDARKKAMLEAAAAEAEIQNIKTLTAGYPELTVKALTEGWDKGRIDTEVELAKIRASRSGAVNIITGTGIERDSMELVLEAALSKSCGLNVEKDPRFSDKILSAADKNFNRIGLQQFIEEAAEHNQYKGVAKRFNQDPAGLMRAAFSTVGISGILSNIANKSLAKGFNAIQQDWKPISAITSVRDFKQITKYSLTGDLKFEKLSPDGEIVHGTLGELSYTNQIETYAKMLAITRQMLINDDLGALNQIPTKLGRGAALQFNHIYWTEFLDNATQPFPVSDANKNYISGPLTALSIASLEQAFTKMLKQIDPDGQPYPITPKYLVVPPELVILAESIRNDLYVINDGNSNAVKVTSANSMRGKFQVVSSPYLSNALYTGNSATAWYLVAEPADLPLIEVAFLDGKQSPTVETAEVDFNQLGIQMRGYFDFGVNYQEARAGLKSKGAA